MNSFKKSQGSILLTVMMVMFVLAIGVAALMLYTSTGIRQVKATGFSMRAFYIAEAGLQHGVKMMVDDLRYTPEGEELSWSDGTIYGPDESIAVAGLQEYPNFTTIKSEPSYNNGTYEVSIASVAGNSHKIWIRSEGAYKGMDRTILTQLVLKNISPWNNAIFAGEGAAGKAINGNVDIRGSVHLLGSSMNDSDPTLIMDYSIYMSGSGGIGNTYEDMPSSLLERVPSILNADSAEDLETCVRIKHGRLDLSGTALVGEDQASASAGYKTTIEGAYVTDGYGGNQGEGNVYSDNGTGHSYDCGDEIEFPRITDPYEGYSSYVEYIRANALVIDNADSLAVLASVDPSTTFSASNANGSITLDGTGNMDVSGIILIDGPVTFTGKTSEVLSYTGKASILVNGDVTFQVDMLTKWFDTYPTDDLIAFMTPNSMTFDKSQLNIMGLFYAEDTITSAKQTSVAGTFFSNYFDMGTNVPSIYQVPETINNLPDGIIGSDDIWVVTQRLWAER